MSLPEVHSAAAQRHVDSAAECHRRMVEGIDLLTREPLAAKAFAMANQAIVLQQIAGRTSLGMCASMSVRNALNTPRDVSPPLNWMKKSQTKTKSVPGVPFRSPFTDEPAGPLGRQAP